MVVSVRSTFVVFGVAYSFGAFSGSMADEFGTGKGATALMFWITTAGTFRSGWSRAAQPTVGTPPLVLVAAAVLSAWPAAHVSGQSIWVGY